MADKLHLADVFLCEQSASVEGDVLKDVVLHGPVSSNGNEYSLGAMQSLAPLLEGRAVYVNHRLGKKARDVEERFGHVANVRVVESDHDGRPRVRGDLHFQRSHKAAPQIVEAYQKGHNYYGTSIVADGTGRTEGRKRFVEQISRVASLDLVDRAATGSLVEQEGDEPADPAAMHADALGQMIMAVVLDTTLDKEAKKKKIAAYLDAADEGTDAAPPPDATPPGPPMSEQAMRKVMGELIEQTLARRDEYVEQELQRRAAVAKYVKPSTTPPAPPAPARTTREEIPTDPEARRKWLRTP